MNTRLLPALTVAGLIALSPAVAFAGGSDSPTPYEVTEAGVTLPDGQVFPAHGHINVRIDGQGYGIHFDPNNGHPGGQWIGASFIPWAAFGVDTGCTEWVQLSQYNEHFGEGGQAPVCFGDETPEPDPEPTPEPEPDPEEPGDEVPLTPLEPATPIEPEPEVPETPEVPEVEAPEATTPEVVTTKTTASTTNGNPEEETAAVPVKATPRTVG